MNKKVYSPYLSEKKSSFFRNIHFLTQNNYDQGADVKKIIFFSLIELLVSIAIIVILMALLLSVLNKARNSADSIACKSLLKQHGVWMQFYQDSFNEYLLPLHQAKNTQNLFWYESYLATDIGPVIGIPGTKSSSAIPGHALGYLYKDSQWITKFNLKIAPQKYMFCSSAEKDFQQSENWKSTGYGVYFNAPLSVGYAYNQFLSCNDSFWKHRDNYQHFRDKQLYKLSNLRKVSPSKVLMLGDNFRAINAFAITGADYWAYFVNDIYFDIGKFGAHGKYMNLLYADGSVTQSNQKTDLSPWYKE